MSLFPEIAKNQKVLDLTTLRHQMIANNIANANTSNYKRSDLSFAETLQAVSERTGAIEKNTPPDLITAELEADLSKGKELAFLYHKYDTSDSGVNFARNDLLFDYKLYEFGGITSPYQRSKNDSVQSALDEVSPIIIKTKNSERLDGNNVSVDLEVSEMIKNTSFYNVLTSSVASKFRLYKSIISAR